jgi:hypothetical protein
LSDQFVALRPIWSFFKFESFIKSFFKCLFLSHHSSIHIHWNFSQITNLLLQAFKPYFKLLSLIECPNLFVMFAKSFTKWLSYCNKLNKLSFKLLSLLKQFETSCLLLSYLTFFLITCMEVLNNIVDLQIFNVHDVSPIWVL